MVDISRELRSVASVDGIRIEFTGHRALDSELTYQTGRGATRIAVSLARVISSVVMKAQARAASKVHRDITEQMFGTRIERISHKDVIAQSGYGVNGKQDRSYAHLYAFENFARSMVIADKWYLRLLVSGTVERYTGQKTSTNSYGMSSTKSTGNTRAYRGRIQGTHEVEYASYREWRIAMYRGQREVARSISEGFKWLNS